MQRLNYYVVPSSVALIICAFVWTNGDTVAAVALKAIFFLLLKRFWGNLFCNSTNVIAEPIIVATRLWWDTSLYFQWDDLIRLSLSHYSWQEPRDQMGDAAPPPSPRLTHAHTQLKNPWCQSTVICQACPLTPCLWKYCSKGHRLEERRDRGERNVREITVAGFSAARLACHFKS